MTVLQLFLDLPRERAESLEFATQRIGHRAHLLSTSCRRLSATLDDPQIPLAKSAGYMAEHTAAGNRVVIVTWNRRNPAERSKIAQPWAHIARAALVPS